MNQKYLQGLSSNMESPNDAVFFEATPENITAFLMQHQWAQMSAIGTVDDRSFLTAKMGLIDTCPDQAYLSQKLLPIYAKVQMGDIPVPELKTVSKEIALAEKCPKPDWNYLRWEGYSDKKYQDILSGKALLEMSWMGEKTSLELQVRSYYSGGNLALLLVDWSQGDPQPWGDLSVNLGKSIAKDCAFIDVNNLGNDILSWIEKNGLGSPTGRNEQSGFVVYPEYRFNPERLKELDDKGYAEYENLLKQQTKGFIDSSIFIERSNHNNQKIEKLRWELRQLQKPDEISNTIDSTKLLLELLENASPMLEFEPAMFKSMVQRIIVHPEKFCFQLVNGLILDEERCLP